MLVLKVHPCKKVQEEVPYIGNPMVVLDMTLLTGDVRLHSSRPDKHAIGTVMDRLSRMENELIREFEALGETHNDGDEMCYKYGLDCMQQYFRSLGAIRCLYMSSSAHDHRLNESQMQASY